SASSGCDPRHSTCGFTSQKARIGEPRLLAQAGAARGRNTAQPLSHSRAVSAAAIVQTGLAFLREVPPPQLTRSRRLLDGDALREVARLIDVRTLENGHV